MKINLVLREGHNNVTSVNALLFDKGYIIDNEIKNTGAFLTISAATIIRDREIERTGESFELDDLTEKTGIRLYSYSEDLTPCFHNQISKADLIKMHNSLVVLGHFRDCVEKAAKKPVYDYSACKPKTLNEVSRYINMIDALLFQRFGLGMPYSRSFRDKALNKQFRDKMLDKIKGWEGGNDVRG